jgi:hypothetical protein
MRDGDGCAKAIAKLEITKVMRGDISEKPLKFRCLLAGFSTPFEEGGTVF